MSMNQDEMKLAVAKAAIEYIKPDMMVGVGTGSTANFFIDELAKIKGKIEGTVASSEASAERLKSHGIPVFSMNEVDVLDIYVDGADEFDRNLHLTKGGGGALTREKIVLAPATKFICIVDESKKVDLLGQYPLPVEVIPMSRSYVARQIVKQLHGEPVYREGFVTDNGCDILDIHGLQIVDPVAMETLLNNIPGVVTNGLFAIRKADVVLMGTPTEVVTITD